MERTQCLRRLVVGGENFIYGGSSASSGWTSSTVGTKLPMLTGITAGSGSACSSLSGVSSRASIRGVSSLASRSCSSALGSMGTSSLSGFAIATSIPWVAGMQRRYFSEAAPSMSPEASTALQNIKDTLKTAPRRKVTLSKKQRRELQGNVGKYQRAGGRPEFHNVDVNRNGRVFEPTDKFSVVVTSSKNNLWIVVVNKAREGRTVFASHAGNIGARKAAKRGPDTTFRVAQNVARKCKRLGVTVVDEVRFRMMMKVESVLQAFQTHGVKITKLLHVPRLPKCEPHKPKKRRRL